MKDVYEALPFWLFLVKVYSRQCSGMIESGVNVDLHRHTHSCTLKLAPHLVELGLQARFNGAHPEISARPLSLFIMSQIGSGEEPIEVQSSCQLREVLPSRCAHF